MIDIFPHNFITRELAKLQPFERRGQFDPAINHYPLPAWKAAFMSCVAECHSGYRLPTRDDFEIKMGHYLRHHTNWRVHFNALYESPYDDDDVIMDEKVFFRPRPGFYYRLDSLYESGIAELFVYTCLVYAFEEISRSGIVVYDPRVDWVHKFDMIVLGQRGPCAIDLHYKNDTPREAILSARAFREELAKANVGNPYRSNVVAREMPILELTCSSDDHFEYNGYRLYSFESINMLIASLYDRNDVPIEMRWLGMELSEA